MRNLILLLILIALGLLACEDRQNPANPQEENELAGSAWQLVQYSSGTGQTSPLSGSVITLQFQGDTLNGRAGCNHYFGEWEYRGGDSLAVSGQIGSTEMFCEGLMKQEQLYLQLLSEATRYAIKDSLLTLRGRAGTLTFRRLSAETQAQPTTESAQPFRGYFRAGNEVSIFRECADTTVVFWLEDTSGTLDSLYRQTTNNKEYEPVLLEMEAVKLPRLDLGYASEYDGLMRVVRVRRIEMPNPQDSCFARMTWG